MQPGLITSWSEHDSHVQGILLLAKRTLRIFDENLARLGLERAENALILRQFLASDRNNALQIILRDGEPFRRNSPRLFRLLGDYPASMIVVECPPLSGTPNDAMLIADDCHALIRFHKDQVRSKVVIDSAADCQSYLFRFREIQNEGGTVISATTLGL
ncbi:DUF7931 domain-containing protein [Propionivibrio sp.]|uniref:DUF7931 domain-containing protein n=1 Tax=Propionivibrio sp. TaxID=2212460 RepID=UPI00272EBFAE|nr:hypothetical protein [Propionivibrio sp.]